MNAPFSAFITSVQWTLIGLTIWQCLDGADYWGWVIGSASIWVLNLIHISRTATYISNHLAPSQAMLIIDQLRSKMSTIPCMTARAYHHVESVYADVDNNLTYTSAEVCTLRLQQRCDATVADTTGVIAPITPKLGKRYVLLTINTCWKYADTTSATNHRQQLDRLIGSIRDKDAHVDGSTKFDKASHKKYYVVERPPPSMIWLQISSLCGLSWFYLEWLYSQTEHQSVNVIKSFTFNPASPTIDIPAIHHPCDCTPCKGRSPVGITIHS